jgi:bile acid:Na+ symporter, BASS family
MSTSIERTISCWLLLGVIVAGYVIPGLPEYFRPFAFPCLFSMILLSLIPMGRMDVDDIVTLDVNVWKIVLWQMFVLPVIIIAAATLLKLSGSIVTLLVVTASAGSLFASPTYAELLKLDRKKALQCMVLSTFIMPLSYFVFFEIVLSAHVEIDLLSFIFRCTIFLVLPMALFLIYMGFARCIPMRITNLVDSFSRRLTILALMIFGVGILGPARDMLYEMPLRFVMFLCIVAILGAGMAYLTAIVMFKHGIKDAMTASIVSGFRNVGLGFVLLPGVLSHETAAYIGISQIPIFLAPLIVNYMVRGRHDVQSTPIMA